MSLDVTHLAGLLVSVVLPLAVGLVTTKTQKGHTKDLLLLALTGLTTACQTVASGNTDLKVVGGTLAVNYLVAVATHYKVYKPTGLADKAQDTLVKDKPFDAGIPEELADVAAPEEATPEELAAIAEADALNTLESEVNE